jgi:glutathione synthase/RimK-type ligase-like ATP-grasp enzyme
LGLEEAVIKPAIGASGHEVTIVRRGALVGGGAAAWTSRTPVVVQEVMPEVGRDGEVSCVFFDGDFSHAALKRPREGEFRVNSQYGGEVTKLALPDSLVAQARAALATLGGMPLYARVDSVLRDGAFVLMELELIEPGLMLDLDPAAAGRFAAATVRRLTRDGTAARPA